jgi:hypothetical protein
MAKQKQRMKKRNKKKKGKKKGKKGKKNGDVLAQKKKSSPSSGRDQCTSWLAGWWIFFSLKCRGAALFLSV